MKNESLDKTSSFYGGYVTLQYYIRKDPKPTRDASLYATNPLVPFYKVHIGVDKRLSLNCWKLCHNPSSTQTWTSFCFKSIDAEAEKDKP